jgi:hypothetical protein
VGHLCRSLVTRALVILRGRCQWVPSASHPRALWCVDPCRQEPSSPTERDALTDFRGVLTGPPLGRRAWRNNPDEIGIPSTCAARIRIPSRNKRDPSHESVRPWTPRRHDCNSEIRAGIATASSAAPGLRVHAQVSATISSSTHPADSAWGSRRASHRILAANFVEFGCLTSIYHAHRTCVPSIESLGSGDQRKQIRRLSP